MNPQVNFARLMRGEGIENAARIHEFARVNDAGFLHLCERGAGDAFPFTRDIRIRQTCMRLDYRRMWSRALR